MSWWVWLLVWLGINVVFALLMWRRGVRRERALQAALHARNSVACKQQSRVLPEGVHPAGARPPRHSISG